MTAISGWVGTGAGLITIGVCVVAFMFVRHLPKFSHPLIHRALIIGMYCGAAAVLVTTIGQYALRVIRDIVGFFGGFSSGIGRVALIITAVLLLLSVAIAVIKLPEPGAAYLAIGLVVVLALVPGGFLHQFYAVTAIPGQQAAGQLSAWLGG
jgi:hypothetical protein